MDKDIEQRNMIAAGKINRKPELIDQIKTRYQIIWDEAMTGLTFNELNRAICLMAEEGWRCVSITSFSRYGIGKPSFFIFMYALMEKIQ